MPTEVLISTASPVTPVTRIDNRVSVGGRALVKRSTPGVITIEIRRGDGGDPETYPNAVEFVDYGPLDAAEEIEAKVAAIDKVGAGTYPRTYQLRIVALGADLSARDIGISTSPYSVPGLG